MCSQIFYQCLLVFLLVYAGVTHGELYYIKPSLDGPCSQGISCLTLSQLAANPNNYYGNNETDLTLLFLPGNHTLVRELSLAHGNNFTMATDSHNHEDVYIECPRQTAGRFNISDVNFVTMKGLHFVGCGGSTVTHVEQLMITDTIFQGAEGTSSALILNEVNAAHIVTSSFLYNRYPISNYSKIFRNTQDILDDVYLRRNSSSATGGALYTAFSNVTMADCRFMHNRAEIGGVILANNSNIHITGSIYINNQASYGGIMVTCECSVDIDNSIFRGNSAQLSGGVMISYNDVFTIRGVIFGDNGATSSAVIRTFNESAFTIAYSYFTNNTATAFNGGVFETSHKSSFDIAHSTFTSNGANSDGGVMSTSSESSFTITNCTFTNNRATHNGGIMNTYDQSAFTISNCTFINNGAQSGGVITASEESSFKINQSTFSDNGAFGGGVLNTFNKSSFTIANSAFTNNSAISGGGVMDTGQESSFIIINSTFANNEASRLGGVMNTMATSSFNISYSTFTDNHAPSGGVIQMSDKTLFTILSSTFSNNSASDGGIMSTLDSQSQVAIIDSIFINNRANSGGVIRTIGDHGSSFDVINSAFTENCASGDGGVIFLFDTSSFTINNSTFTNNRAAMGGVVESLIENSLFNITHSTFTNNSASSGGVFDVSESLISITNSRFANNSATEYGGVIAALDSSFISTNSIFISNSANSGGVIEKTGGSVFTATSCSFAHNSAADIGGVLWCSDGSINISNSSFTFNSADNYGGVMFISRCSTHIKNSNFDRNIGSLYVFYSNLTLSGNTTVENCTEPPDAGDTITRQDGGAITSFQSTIVFYGAIISLLNNQARRGGAILATESILMMYGEIFITNNTATSSSGGGISLYQSSLQINGHCDISNNHATRGGGIHATSSTIVVFQSGKLQFINNRAEIGGGIYLEVTPKLYMLKDRYSCIDETLLNFINNNASYGGAIFIADDTNSGVCSPDNECFIQTLALYQGIPTCTRTNTADLRFSGNTATKRGYNIFGGLFDRCIPSPFAEVYKIHSNQLYQDGVTYLQNISNTPVDSIASQPVRICFCLRNGKPNCSYKHPPIRVKKGESFNISLVAVDHVNNTLDANILSILSSSEGGFGEGQQTQHVQNYCTDVTYNVFSVQDSETINLYADGPCGSTSISTSHVTIHFEDCTCPVGFKPLSSDHSSTTCDCICDSELFPYIKSCNSTTNSLLRINTNSWITYINDTDSPGYVIHPNCPFDYCQSPTDKVSINFNVPNGADAQCKYNRKGVLCGACQESHSLSLGSSRCLPCNRYWPAVLAAIIITFIIAGIILVIVLLALNITVASGLINGFIFYANIIAAGRAVFFPSSELSFPSVFVAWLNLEIGFDVCFFDGLDAYSKTWLQLAFPVYIIILVIVVIIVSEYSSRFAALIGRRDPIATLATLILLSYAKLLSIIITGLSLAVLRYPDGSLETIWLPDGSVNFFQGKHIPLALVALLILLILVLPYTIILFFWQWIICAPGWKIFRWTRHTKFNAFITAYHVPYNNKYRFWTGLLLLVRVVLYITAAFTESANPQVMPLLMNILVGGLLILKGVFGLRVYKKSLIDIVNTMLYFNLLTLSVFSLYDFNSNIAKQTAVAYTSTIITLILLIGMIIYHVMLLIKKDKPSSKTESHECLLASMELPTVEANSEVTYSILELPKGDQDTQTTQETYVEESESV